MGDFPDFGCIDAKSSHIISVTYTWLSSVKAGSPFSSWGTTSGTTSIAQEVSSLLNRCLWALTPTQLLQAMLDSVVTIHGMVEMATLNFFCWTADNQKTCWVWYFSGSLEILVSLLGNVFQQLLGSILATAVTVSGCMHTGYLIGLTSNEPLEKDIRLMAH